MNDTINLLGQQVPVALVLVYLQNWMKKQEWFPWLTYESARLNHLAAIVLAGAATLGIHETHTGSAMSGGTITIVMPPLAVIVAGLWHWVTQYVFSKTAYTFMQSQINPVTLKQPTPVIVVPASKELTHEPEVPANH